MPQLPDVERPQRTIATSVGGSTLFPEGKWNESYVDALGAFFGEQLAQEKTVIAIIGGGSLARQRIEAARKNGVTHSQLLDVVGIIATLENAVRFAEQQIKRSVSVEFYTRDAQLKGGVLFVGGGSEPNHTTDFVAVEAAHKAGETVMLNISVAGVIHPMINDTPDETKTLEEMTWNDYISTIAHQHTPGLSSPLDLPAAEYAREHGMTVIFLGPDIHNIEQCLRGEEFIGTIVHP